MATSSPMKVAAIYIPYTINLDSGELAEVLSWMSSETNKTTAQQQLCSAASVCVFLEFVYVFGAHTGNCMEREIRASARIKSMYQLLLMRFSTATV